MRDMTSKSLTALLRLHDNGRPINVGTSIDHVARNTADALASRGMVTYDDTRTSIKISDVGRQMIDHAFAKGQRYARVQIVVGFVVPVDDVNGDWINDACARDVTIDTGVVVHKWAHGGVILTAKEVEELRDRIKKAG